MSLAGRVALVTGGGRGVGRGIAMSLAEAGATVAVNYRRDEEAAAATVAEIISNGGKAQSPVVGGVWWIPTRRKCAELSQPTPLGRIIWPV